jgi:Phytanoyl-CoA dioxygenase (PhyH)
MTSPLAKELEHHGIVLVPDLVSPQQLAGMQRAFERRLRRLRWNDFDGYEKTESYRHVVQDVLTLHQGFVDVALAPVVKEALREYLGDGYALVEAKGWKSLPTKRDFHGWHGDAWYDQSSVQGIPREVKLGLYLTDVRSGAFNYVKGSHGKQVPHLLRKDEAQQVPREQIMEVIGPAGSAFLFDTSGTHRQAMPILEPRQAVFYNYHHPDVPLQKEDVDYYRYHPLLLNAAFLGGLSAEDQHILGFGNKTHYLEGFERQSRHPVYERLLAGLFSLNLRAHEFGRRVTGKLGRLFRWRKS